MTELAERIKFLTFGFCKDDLENIFKKYDLDYRFISITKNKIEEDKIIPDLSNNTDDPGCPPISTYCYEISREDLNYFRIVEKDFDKLFLKEKGAYSFYGLTDDTLLWNNN